MFRIRLFAKMVTPSLPILNKTYKIPIQNGVCTSAARNSKITTQSPNLMDDNIKKSFLERLFNKIPFMNLEKNKLAVAGYFLYESVADQVNYAAFFDEFSLPDTFYSWFVITELHVWMLMVRCMAEGESGRFVRNKIVEAMWVDVTVRAKKLGANNPNLIRAQINELSEQFQSALIAYDEGLLADDKVLAGAVWRRIYQQLSAEPEQLDGLVKYIRKQTLLLDDYSFLHMTQKKKVNWEKLHNI